MVIKVKIYHFYGGKISQEVIAASFSIEEVKNYRGSQISDIFKEKEKNLLATYFPFVYLIFMMVCD